MRSNHIRLAWFAVLLTIFMSEFAVAGPPTFPLTTEVSPAGAGTIEPSSGDYQRNNIVPIAANAAAGWVFDHWEGDLSGTTNPTQVRIKGATHVIAVFVDPNGDPGPGPGGEDPPPRPLPEDQELIGYFAQWAIYRRDYLVQNVVESGAAEKLTAINYAFAGISQDLKCASLDTFADWEKAFDANESVDGVEDSFNEPLRGNFNQLRKLKLQYPYLRILISIGGWNDSNRFSDAALPDNAQQFVSSCVDMFIHGNFADGVAGPGIFDGIDIDWEYPGRCGATCDFRPEDGENFTALLSEFRSQLDAIDPELLLTIAAPASEYHYSQIELDQIHPTLDWINVMTYDYHGPWESSGPTNHHAPLYSSAADPTAGGSADETMQAYLGIVPADKLTLGIPFYGHGWTGVDSADNGLYQDARGVARGKYERGSDDYEELEKNNFPGFWDSESEAYWIFNGREFWSYDNPASAQNKASYAQSFNLRGVMFWELSGDDPQGSLITSVLEGLGGTPEP